MFDLLKRIDSKNRFEGACMENRSIRFVTSIAICPDQIVRAPVSELVDIVLHFAVFGKDSHFDFIIFFNHQNL